MSLLELLHISCPLLKTFNIREKVESEIERRKIHQNFQGKCREKVGGKIGQSANNFWQVTPGADSYGF